jgi:uncharacterized membrane protein
MTVDRRAGTDPWQGLDWPLIVMVVAGIVATTWVAVLLVGRADGLSAPPYDLAFFQQVVWNIGQDARWVSSFHDGSFLGLHFSPILVVPALVERFVWPDVRVLSLIHAATIGAFVPATFLFLRAGFRPSRVGALLAAVLAISLPLWGAMQDTIRSDFHPEVTGIVLALLAGWAGLTGHSRTLWILAIVALLTREDVSYAVFVLGLVIATRGPRRSRRQGRVLSVVAVGWGIVIFGFLMPLIRAGAPSETATYYAWLGGGLDVLLAPFTKTDAVLAALTRPAPWFVFAGMVVSLGGLPLLRPRWAALVLPPLVALMLSDHFWQAGLRLQYPMILVVPLLAATLFGGRRALAFIGRRRRDGQRRLAIASLSALLTVAIVPAVAGAWIQGSLPPFDGTDPAFLPRNGAIDRLHRVAAAVPDSALLLADEGLLAPLASRAQVRRLVAAPIPPATAYVIVDRDAWSPTSNIARLHARLSAALSAGDRPVIVDDGRFVLWGPEPGAATR